MSDEPAIGLDVGEPVVAKPAAPATKELQITEVAALVADMNLFLTRLAELPPFGEAQLTVADWLLLTDLTQRQPTIKQLSKALGIALPRVQIIVDRLKTRGLLDGQPSETDPKIVTIVLTKNGQDAAASMNAGLMGIFDASADRFESGVIGRDRTFYAFARYLKFLHRMVAAPSPEKAA